MWCFIQAKWKDKAESISNINHYIKCCENVINDKKIDESNVYHIYASKVPVSKPSNDALNNLTNSDNINSDDMDRCVHMVLIKACEIFGAKVPKYKKQILCNNDKLVLEGMKKAELIGSVMCKYGYSKTKATKLRHAELVKLLLDYPSDSETPISDEKSDEKSDDKSGKKVRKNKKIQEDNMLIEFDDPSKRNPGEMKSKLLKPGSELWNHITKLKNILRQRGFAHLDRMGLHIEVLNSSDETIETYLSRVKVLEGKEINAFNPDIYDIVGKAVVMMIGEIDGYNKDVKIVIAYFDDDNKTANGLKCVIENL